MAYALSSIGVLVATHDGPSSVLSLRRYLDLQPIWTMDLDGATVESLATSDAAVVAIVRLPGGNTAVRGYW